MTTLKLPRPRKGHMDTVEKLTLDVLGLLDRSRDGIADLSVDAMAASLRSNVDEIKETLTSLEARGRILLAPKHFAITSRLSRNLKLERDRNRQRELIASGQHHARADWSLHKRAQQIFPALRSPVERPASYNRPAAFEKLLSEHASHHRRDCPANVEIVSEACYPGELSTVLTMIEEQRSAHRTVVLLYTRKALYLGVQRAPKR